jgi:hypothetical protein
MAAALEEAHQRLVVHRDFKPQLVHMPQCWARSLGNCSGKISGEHRITEAISPARKIAVKESPVAMSNTSSLHEMPTRLTSSAPGTIAIYRQSTMWELTRSAASVQLQNFTHCENQWWRSGLGRVALTFTITILTARSWSAGFSKHLSTWNSLESSVCL